jgi:hypothetical protein
MYLKPIGDFTMSNRKKKTSPSVRNATTDAATQTVAELIQQSGDQVGVSASQPTHLPSAARRESEDPMTNTLEPSAAQDTPACGTTVETTVGIQTDKNGPPDGSRDGSNINNRATAPNNPKTMNENIKDAIASTVEVDSTTTPAAVNNIAAQGAPASQAAAQGVDASNTNQPVTPIASLGLPDEKIGLASGENRSMFDPESLRVPQDFDEQADVEPILGTIPVRKPGKQEFIRVRSGEEWKIKIAVIESSEDGQLYVVVPGLAKTVSEEVATVWLRLAVNLNGVPSLWPLKISKDGKSNPWNQSAMVAADTATTRWVRVRSNQTTGQYNIVAAKHDLGEPKWPDMSLQEILQLAFKDRIITSHDHPLLKQLRGEL